MAAALRGFRYLVGRCNKHDFAYGKEDKLTFFTLCESALAVFEAQ